VVSTKAKVRLLLVIVMFLHVARMHLLGNGWCIQLRVSYKKMKNNQKQHTKLAHAQIQCLTDAGFKWSLKSGCF
jgi:hypothetical protein